MATEAPAPAAQPQGWQGGRWLAARWQASPNFGERPPGMAVELIVVHSISLPPGRYGGPQVIELFTNRLNWNAHPYFQSIRGLEVSSHFFVRRSGQVWQFVDTFARAWHAGRSSWQGRDNCNDYAVGIELEGLEGRSFTAAQYRALAELVRALERRHPICAIAGHEDVAPGRKHDPGPGFDWRRLRRRLGGTALKFPPSVTN